MISVIIPTYNRADLLPKAILSVKNQTFEDLEIIVVDDASTDNTPEVVKGLLGKNDTYIKLLTNSGSSTRPRNEGLKIARGEYIALLDSDDWLEPICLEKLYQKMIASGHSVGVVYSGVYMVDIYGNILKILYDDYESGYLFEKQLTNCISAVTGSLIKSECFKVCGLFDEGEILPHDDMWIRLAKHYEFECVQECLAYCLIHDEQFSQNVNLANYYINILEKHWESYNTYPNSLRAMYRQIAYRYIQMGNKKEFLKYSKLSNPNHRPINYILMILLLIHPKLPEIISPIYQSVIKYLPGNLRLER